MSFINGKNCNISESVIFEGEKFTKLGDNVIIGHYVIIKSGVHIGNNVKIEPFTIIHDNVVIADGSEIGSHTILHKNSKFGENTFIGPYCELGSNMIVSYGCIIQGRNRTANGCFLEENVTIKYGTILTSDVHLKKNCFLGPNVITLGSTHERVTKHGTVIGEDCFIGSGTKIAGATEICNNVVTGANSFVNKDILDSGIYCGTPVKKIK